MVPSADTLGHGTQVAGLIAGKTVGVAPGAQLLSSIMIPGGRGTVSSFILALDWIARRHFNVPIVNMSAGLPGYIPELREVLKNVLRVGMIPIFAIGNEGPDNTRSPGNYTDVISVGAADHRGDSYSVASFSGGGTLLVDNHLYSVPCLVAPGKEVYSSMMGGGYRAASGTSMATPIVAGVAALILEKSPKLGLLELKDELLSTCQDLGLPPARQGKGLVQIKAAYESK
jgi:subtilisin family serine protease